MIEVDPRWPRAPVQLDVPDRARRTAVYVPQGQSVDSVRVQSSRTISTGTTSPSFRWPTRRSAGSAARSATTGSFRGDPPTRRERRRGADARLRLHGSVGRDGADELVDAREPLPPLRTRRSSSPGTRARPAATIRRTRGAGRQPGGRLRRACPRRSVSGPGERIVVAPIDITALRHERQTRRGHHMLAHLRSGGRTPCTRRTGILQRPRPELSYERNVELIERAKAERRALPSPGTSRPEWPRHLSHCRRRD